MVGWYPYWRRCRAATKPSPPRERQVNLCPQVRELRRRYHKQTIVAGATGYENPATSAGRVNTVDSTGGKIMLVSIKRLPRSRVEEQGTGPPASTWAAWRPYQPGRRRDRPAP